MAKKKTETNTFPWGLVVIVAAIAASALVVTLLFPTIQSMSPTNIFEFVQDPSPTKTSAANPSTMPPPLKDTTETPPSTETTETETQPDPEKSSSQSNTATSEPSP